MKAPVVHSVDVQVNGSVYPIACPSGEEARLRELASFLDDRTSKLAVQFSHAGVSISEKRLLVMTALTLVDELAEANSRLNAYEEHGSQNGAINADDAQLLTTRIQRLAARITSISEKVRA